jgi:chromosome segregation ATPase
MTRRTMAERKRRAAERDTRRESLLVLLSRARRGVPLTPAEAGLMFAHVEVELAEADELRRTVQGQQTAIQAAHDRTAAAEAAIRETEQRAVDAEEQLSAYRAVEAYRQAADTFEGRLAAIRQQTTEGILTAAERLHERAEQAEERLAAYVDIFGPDAVDDFHKMQHRAVTAEAVTAETKRLMERRTTTLRERAEQAEDLLRAAHQCSNEAERQRADAEQRASIAETELATLREGIRQCGGDPTSVQNVYAQLQSRTRQWRDAEQRAEAAARVGVRHMAAAERYEAAWRSARRRARGWAAEEQRVRGWLEHWADRARLAEAALARVHRDAVRLGLAWRSARRRARAAEAALAAELPDVIAGQQARAALAEPARP